jgi:general stress protein YciG
VASNGARGYDERMETNANGKQRRGFNALSPERQRAIASAGGKASHAPGGKGHEWNREEAIEAGRKGGRASRGGKGKAAPTG